MRRVGLLAVLMAIVSSLLVFDAAADAPVTARDLCGQHDRPEGVGIDGTPAPQLQGDVPKSHRVEGPDGVSRAELGYNCGLTLVGHTSLDNGSRATSNANMAWVKDCAYVAGNSAAFGPATPKDSNGVAVVQVSPKGIPTHVRTLDSKTPGATAGTTTGFETINAVEHPDGRALLVVGTYGNQSGGDKPMDIYDVSNCADPVHLFTYRWPENIHNLTITEDLKYVFATQPLQAIDITNPASPQPLGNIEDVMPYPLVATGPYPDLDDNLPQPVREARKDGYTAHEAWPVSERQADGSVRRLLYLGGQLPIYEAFSIVDITKWLDRSSGGPAGPPEILSQREGRGHSVRTATIAGKNGKLLQDASGAPRRFVLHSEESVLGQANGCTSEELNPFAGAAEPWLTDATDPTNPQMRISQFHLEINRRENCPAQLDSGIQASVHYHDFDREDGARFAMLSMQGAGIRVIDVRNPENPVEIAYYNPGDVARGTPQNRSDNTFQADNAWAHIRYVEKTGQIWFATARGGFWVVELGSKVRGYLNGSSTTRPTPEPEPIVPALPLATLGPDMATVAATYCTLGGTTSRA